MAEQWGVEVIFRGGMSSTIACRNIDEATERVNNLRAAKHVESAHITSISPHPTMPQPETNCPRIDGSKLSGHDQVTRDEFDQEAM